MAALSKDDIECQLRTYKDQLAAVSECIQLSEEPVNVELMELHQNLQQLVSLTEGNITVAL
jgi:hypothetical protein